MFAVVSLPALMMESQPWIVWSLVASPKHHFLSWSSVCAFAADACNNPAANNTARKTNFDVGKDMRASQPG